MKPTISVLAPSTETRNTGSRPWIISDEISMNRLTKPSAQMLPGNRVSDDFRLVRGGSFGHAPQSYAMIGKTSLRFGLVVYAEDRVWNALKREKLMSADDDKWAKRLFLEARTHNGWKEQKIGDDTAESSCLH